MRSTPPSIFLIHKYGRKAASFRYRLEQYLPAIKSAGYRYQIASLLDDEYLKQRFTSGKRNYALSIRLYFRHLWALRRAFKSDLVVICVEAFPYCPSLFELSLHLFRIPYIYDFDDPIFHYYDLNPNFLVRTLFGRKISNVIRRAQVAFCGSHYLVEYARKARGKSETPDIQLLPTVIDLNDYPRPIKNHESESECLVIGWIGSPSTAEYLEVVIPALRRLSQEFSLKLLLIGSGPKAWDGVQVEVHPWAEETEKALLLKCDLGINPLLGDLWCQGKCGFKIIQYMACGLPVVVTPVGENKHIVQDGEQGIFATSEEDWVRAIRELQKNRSLRSRLGEKGRKSVEERYSLQITESQFLGAIHSIVKGEK